TFQDGKQHINQNGQLVQDLLEVVNGNELRVRADSSVSQTDLEGLELRITVVDDGDRSLSSPESNPYVVPSSLFTQDADTLARSESVVLPLVSTSGDSAPEEPIQFAATGLDGALSVQSAGVLSGEDIQSQVNLDVGDGRELEEVVPLAPLLDFTINTNNPGDLVRFEFSLPDLPLDDLLDIQYLKLFPDGNYAPFTYQRDEFGVYTGARLEQRVKNSDDSYTDNFSAVTDADSFDPLESVYLAVYVQDNGFGDDDPTLGLVRDPGLPMLLNLVAVETVGESIGGGGETSADGDTNNNDILDLPVIPDDGLSDGVPNGDIDDDLLNPAPPVQSIIKLPPGQLDVTTGSSSDNIVANKNPNKVISGAGDDIIISRQGDDFVRAGVGNDVIRAGKGADEVRGGEGDDVVRGGKGADEVRGGEGDDDLSGGRGADEVKGGVGDDVVKGNKGDDFLRGNRGDDVLRGGKGHDFVSGGKGSDHVHGNIGNDHLRGVDATSSRGAGEVDQLSGGSGADIFYLGDKSGAYYLDLESGIVGYAFISDFDLKDKLAFHQTEGIRIVHQQTLD
ncbi:MAG: calcium-binding protein, partial [Actinomycetota bacterium]|nr:calcium-binding protein [Actinomycetota bacterium]